MLNGKTKRCWISNNVPKKEFEIILVYLANCPKKSNREESVAFGCGANNTGNGGGHISLSLVTPMTSEG